MDGARGFCGCTCLLLHISLASVYSCSGAPALACNLHVVPLVTDLIDAINAVGSSIQDELNVAVIWFGVLTGVMLIFGTILVFSQAYVADHTVKRVKQAYLRALLQRSIAYHDANPTGDLAMRGTTLAETMLSGMGMKLGLLLMYGFMAVSGILVGFVFDWKLSLIVLACVVPIMFTGLMLKKAQQYTEAEQTAYGNANALAVAALTAFRTVVSYGRQLHEHARYVAQLLRAEHAQSRKGFWSSASMGVGFSLVWVAFGVTLYLAGVLIIQAREDHPDTCDPATVFALRGPENFSFNDCQGLTGGVALTVIFSVLFGGFSVAQIGPSLSALSASRAAAARLYEVTEAEPDLSASEGKQQLASCRQVEFRNVHFAYPGQQQPALQGLSFTIEPGQTVALVGPSGSGKSTTMQLLLKFFNADQVPDDPDSGVFIDGHNLRDLDADSVRKFFGYVAQQPALFATSIYNNIAFGAGEDSEVSAEQVHSAAKLAHAHGFIEQLEDKYDTQAGAAGNALSGGQRQRICIARALVSQPSLLLLDEATAALDNESERKVQAALDDIAEHSQSSKLVIAHRLSTIHNADKIVVIDHGRAVEVGTHLELMEKQGVYASLYALSQQGASDQQGSREGAAAGSGDAASKAGEGAASGDADDDGDEESRQKEGGPEQGTASGTVDDNKQSKADEAGPLPSTRFLWLASQPDKWYLALGIFAAGVGGAAMPVSTLVFTEVIAALFALDNQTLKDETTKWMAVLLSLGVLLACTELARSLGFSVAGARLVRRIRAAVYRAVLRQDVAWHNERSAGAVTDMLSTDCTLVQGLTGERVGIMVMNIATLTLGLIFAFTASWQIALITLGTFPLMAVGAMLEQSAFQNMNGTANTNAKHVGGDKAAELGKSATSQASHIALEAMQQVRVVHALRLKGRITALYDELLSSVDHAQIKSNLLSGFGFGLSQALQYATYMIVFGFGGYLVADGHVSASNLFKAFFCITMMAYGVGQASAMATDANKAKGALRRISTLLTSEPSILAKWTDDTDELAAIVACAHASAAQPASGATQQADAATAAPPAAKPAADTAQKDEYAIEFRDVSFTYPGREKPALAGLSFKVKVGQTVALVGFSGSGKSTAVSMLQRFYDVQSGSILVHGTDVRDMPAADLRARQALVQQEPMLFEGTNIAYNIAYGAADGGILPERAGLVGATAEPTPEVAAVAGEANALGFIREQEDQFLTQAALLSGGQKQRVCIARALMRCQDTEAGHADILLFDEATSALDNESERVVQASIDTILQSNKVTSLVIAHRLSTVRNADCIVVMQDGRAVESGTHDELLAAQGAYWQLLNATAHSSTPAVEAQ